LRSVNERFAAARRDDRGIGLPEMLVAMVIFTLISTSVLYGMLAVLQLSRESRAMQVATNLASEEIDVVRSADDVFAIVDSTRDVQLNGDTFEITRTARWVSDPDIDLDCGSGGAPLRYKRVSVDVRWSNMRDTDDPVSSYTIITPRTRINDPARGTILVSALGAGGTGTAGAGVSVVPASPSGGAEIPEENPPATDTQGCSFALRLTPGNYVVSLSRAGYISGDQVASPTRTVNVEASSSTSAGFLYDAAARVTVNYASNRPATGPSPVLPNGMATSFVSSYGLYQDVASTSSTTRSLDLFPFSSGYEVIPGAFSEPNDVNNGCRAVDPAAWEPLDEGAQTLVGERAGPVAASPGDSAVIDVPMGIVDIRGGTPGRFLRAESVNASGPGCEVTMNYTFDGQILPSNSGSTVRVALPYGSWRLYSGGGGAQNNPISGFFITPVTRGDVGGTLPGVLTLDPREVPQ